MGGESGAAAAIVLEHRTLAVEGVAIDFHGYPVFGKQQIDLHAGDPGVGPGTGHPRLPESFQQQELGRRPGEIRRHDVIEKGEQLPAAGSSGISMGEGADLVERDEVPSLGPGEGPLEVVRAEAGCQVEDRAPGGGYSQPVPRLDLVGRQGSDAVDADAGPWPAQGTRPGNVEWALRVGARG